MSTQATLDPKDGVVTTKEGWLEAAALGDPRLAN